MRFKNKTVIVTGGGDWKPLNEPYQLLQKQQFTFRDIEKMVGGITLALRSRSLNKAAKIASFFL